MTVASSNISIHAKGVHFKYPNVKHSTLKNITTSITPNAINGLIGPNGAGKSTLINLFCGLLLPTSGQIHYNNSLQPSINKNIKSKIGFVPQYDGLFDTLTLRQNITYFGRLYGIKKEVLNARMFTLSESVNLTSQLDKQLKHYSGGMNRRANIITSLIHNPELVIFDEPTSGVDAQSRQLIQRMIHDLKADGKTILYTSHLLLEAEKLCDSVIIIDQGEIILQGATDQVKSEVGSNTLEEAFFVLTGNQIRD